MVLFLLFNIYKGWFKGDSAGQDEAASGDEKEEAGQTRALLVKTLRKMGCEPVTEEGSEKIWFDYQGEHFYVNASNDSLFITVYDAWWYQVEMDNIEEFARMQKTVNWMNGWASSTVLYTIGHEKALGGVHLKRHMLFVDSIPELEQYLLGTLDDFFQLQRVFVTEMEKQKVKEETL